MRKDCDSQGRPQTKRGHVQARRFMQNEHKHTDREHNTTDNYFSASLFFSPFRICVYRGSLTRSGSSATNDSMSFFNSFAFCSGVMSSSASSYMTTRKIVIHKCTGCTSNSHEWRPFFADTSRTFQTAPLYPAQSPPMLPPQSCSQRRRHSLVWILQPSTVQRMGMWS